MKAIDFLKLFADINESLITLSVALLSLSITFIDKLKANLKRNDYSLFIALWFLLTLSIFIGLLSLYAGANQAVECANPKGNCETSSLMEYSFIANLVVFFGSLVILAVIGYKSLTNSKTDNSKIEKAESVSVVPTELNKSNEQTNESKDKANTDNATS